MVEERPNKDMTRTMNWMDVTALILVVIGALNWGLVGAFGFNLVSAIFGEATLLERTVYILVGIAGVYTIWPTAKAWQDAASKPSRGRPM